MRPHPMQPAMRSRARVRSTGERLKFTEHRGDELGDGRVNVNGALYDCVRRLGVHDVQNRVNGFVATDAQDGCAQDLTRIGIYDDLHEASRLSLFNSPGHLGHRALAYERPSAGPADFVFGQADPPERRIDKHPVGWDAVADPTRVVVQQIGRDDLEIIE